MKAAKRALDQFGLVLLFAVIVYFIIAVGLHLLTPEDVLEEKFWGFTGDFWINAGTPVLILIVLFIIAVAMAPYEIYLEQFAKHAKENEANENALKELREQIAEKVTKEEKKRFLHNSIVKLEQQMRGWTAKRYFDGPSGEEKRRVIDVIEEIYQDMYDKIGADAAALYAAAKGTQKPGGRFGYISEHDPQWWSFLDYIDSKIDVIKTIIEKQL